jgi:hypothetical protein
MNRSATVLGLLAAGTACLLAGCALSARTDYDPRVSMAGCHSYAFADRSLQQPVAAFGNPLNDKRMREAIAGNLAARGIAPVAEGGAADCIVSYAIGSRLAADPADPRLQWGLGWGGWGRHGWGGSLAWGGPYDYREGRVTVDLYDAHSHEALWHAYVDEDVTGLTGADAEKRIREAVNVIFQKFPTAAPAPPATSASRS